MGAAASVSDEDVPSDQKETNCSPSQQSCSKATSTTVCAGCNAPLSILKRRKCSRCCELYCARCMAAVSGWYGGGGGRSTCAKCRALETGDYTADDLAQNFSARELRRFLSSHDVPIDGCTEKHDLINLIMHTQHSSASAAEEEEHSLHVRQLRENMSELQSEPISSTDGISGDAASSAQHENVSGASNAYDDSNRDRSPSEDMRVRECHVTLDNIGSYDDIDRLTVRQLKDLLVNHYVDYRGCCEKPELVKRVRELWNDHKTSDQSTDAELDAVKDDDLCKVCMNAVINCLLLECGHMVSCIGCGKQLAECPICRRYVSRIVRIFRT